MTIRSILQRTKLHTDELLHALHTALRSDSRPQGKFTPTILEDRIYLSAAPIAAQPTETVEQLDAVEASHDAATEFNVRGDAAQAKRVREVIFVDTSTENYDVLLDDIRANHHDFANVSIVLLDARSNGIAQINAELLDHQDLSAIHIVSHGSNGRARLGDMWLSADSLPSYAAPVADWGSALASDGDILFYGCNLAATDDGKELLESVAALTAAEVAGSDDLTGSETYGGNWQLEFSTGLVETGSLFTVNAQPDWQGLLATLTVTNSSDESNGAVSSINALLADDGGDGISLREAISAANNTINFAGPDEIHFGLTGGSGFYVIDVDALTRISDAVIIDGATQTGYDGLTPRIIIQEAGSGNGIEIDNSGSGSTIRGLTLVGFQDAIRSNAGNDNTIESNHIGFDPSLTVAGPTQGSLLNGIVVQNGSGHTIDGNFIVDSGSAGISLIDGVSDTTVINNSIGIDALGDSRGNLGNGVEAKGTTTTNVEIGRIGSGNIIADSGFNGVFVGELATSISIRGNSIYDNSLLGIDLSGGTENSFGVTSNQTLGPIDSDTGANRLRNPPTITSATSNGVTTTVTASLLVDNSDNSYVIDFYSSPIADPSGHGEGRTYLGSQSTGAISGSNNYTVTLPEAANGQFVSGTTTIANYTGTFGDTSEFSQAVAVTADNAPVADLDGNNSTGALGADSHATFLNGAVRIADTDAVISDLDNSNTFFQMNVRIQNLLDGSSEILVADTSAFPNLSTIYNSTFGILSINGIGTKADYESVLRNITYNNTATAPNRAPRVVTVELTDSAAFGLPSRSQITYGNTQPALVFSSRQNVTESPFPGLGEWTNQDFIQLTDPSLSLESGDGTAGVSNGTFSEAIDFDSFTGVGANNDAVHYIQSAIMVGGVTLDVGDVLFSTTVNMPYSSINTVSPNPGDVYAFKSATEGNYTSGTFHLLFDASALSLPSITAFTLVEADVTVGDRQLERGDFLYGTGTNNLFHYDSSSSTSLLLIDGGDVNIGPDITGVDILESNILLGGRSYAQGNILLTLGAADEVLGIQVGDTDVLALNLTSTGNGTTTGTGRLLFDGSDLALDSVANWDAFSLAEITFDNTEQELDSLGSNHAPVLSNTLVPTFDGITENDVDNSGESIYDVLATAGDPITDTDVGAVEGIAVIVNNENAGTWEYSLDNGVSWAAVGAVDNSTALLLRSTDMLRLNPNGVIGENANIGFRAWDQTTGTAGTKVNIPSVGGSSAFSSDTLSATILVEDIGDDLTLDLDADDSAGTLGANFATTFFEDSGPVLIVDTVDASLLDTGNTIQTLTVTLTNPLSGLDESLSATATANISVNYVGATGILKLTNLGTATSTEFEAALRTVSYNNLSQGTDTTPRVIQFVANDGTADSNVATTTVHIVGENDAPTLDNRGTVDFSTINEDESNNNGDALAELIATATVGNLISDPDAASLMGVAITNAVSGTGQWQYSIDGGATWVSLPLVSESNALLLRDIDRLRFVPNGVSGDTAQISFRAWDQTTGTAGTLAEVNDNGGVSAFSSNSETADLVVTAANDAPEFEHGFATQDATFAGAYQNTFTGRSVAFGDDPLSVVTSQTYNLSVSAFAGDGLGGGSSPEVFHYLGFASYDIDGNHIGSQHYLKHSTATDTTLAVDLNPGDTQIVLTDATGWYDGEVPPRTASRRSLAWYGYQDSTGHTYADYTYTRNVALDLWDENAITGNTITLRKPWAGPVLAAGDAVRNASTGGTYNYPLAIAQTIPKVETEYTVTIGGGEITDGLTSQTLFRPGTTSIRALVLANYTPINAPNDTSSLLTIDNFEIRTTSGPYVNGVNTFTEDRAAIDLLDSNAAIHDVDDTFIESVTIQLANGRTDDILHVNEAALHAMGISVTGTQTGPLTSDGVVALTLTADVAESVTRSEFLSALRNIQFENTSDGPNTSDRFVAFVANDGELDSAIDSMTIRVVAVNDAPQLDDTNEFLLTATNEDDFAPSGDAVVELIASLGNPITDVDLGAIEGLAIYGAETANGLWQYSTDSTNWLNLSSVSETNALLLDTTARIRFIPAADFHGMSKLDFRAWDQSFGSNGQRNVDVTTNGGNTAFSSQTNKIVATVTPLNDAPVVNDQTLNVDENSANGTVVGTIAHGDNDMDPHVVTETGGTGAAAFDVLANGQIVVANGTLLDFETTTSFTFDVLVTDSATTLTDTATITININDVANIISGTAYTDEGTTPAIAGETVRVLIDGTDVGSATTDASGFYSISVAKEVAMGETVVAFLDNASDTATTVTVASGRDLTDFDLYSDHIVVRSDAGSATNNTDLSNAIGNYVDTDILYSTTGTVVSTTQSTTEFYVGIGHSFESTDELQLFDVKVLGDVDAGAELWRVDGNFDTATGSFEARTSTIAFGGANTIINMGEASLHNVELDVSGITTLMPELDIDGSLLIENAVDLAGDIRVAGDITSRDSDFNAKQITLYGTQNQTVRGEQDTNGYGQLANLVIAKQGGVATLEGGIELGGSMVQHQSGAVDAGDSTVYFDFLTDIDTGTIEFNNVVFELGTVTIANTLFVNGQLDFEQVTDLSGGEIRARGDVVSSDEDFDGTTRLILDGLDDQTVSGNDGELSDTGDIPHLTVDKVSGIATFRDTLEFVSLHHVTGSTDVFGARFVFEGAAGTIQSGSMELGDVIFDALGTKTIVDTLDVNGDITLDQASRIDGGELRLAGNLHSNDLDIAGTTSIRLDGPGNQTISGNEINDGNLIVDKISGTVTLSDDLLHNDLATQQLVLVNGQFDAAGHTVAIGQNVVVQGGAIYLASGSIDGDLLVEPGGRIAFDVGGVSVGLYDTLHVSGNATFGPSSNLLLDLAGFRSSGTVEDFLTYGSRAGTFQIVDALNFNPDLVKPEVLYDSPIGAMDLRLNSAPILTLPGPAVEFVEDTGPVLLDQLATVTDTDPLGFDGGSLIVGFSDGSTTNDQIILNPSESVALNGDNIIVAGTTIGSLRGGASGVPLTLQWNANADAGNIQLVVRRIAFNNVAQNPLANDRTVDLELTDTTGTSSNLATQTIRVTPQPDRPILDLDANDSSGSLGDGYTTTFTEDGPPISIVDTDATITDADSTTLQSLTVILNNPIDDQFESLTSVVTGTAIRSEWDSATGTLSLSGVDSVENYEQVLRSVRYENTSQAPNTSPRVLTIVANDGTQDSNLATTSITVHAQNDAPVVTTPSNRAVFNRHDPPVPIDGAATVIDSDLRDFNGGVLTVRFLDGFESGDQLVIRNEGVGPGQVGAIGSNVFYEGTLVGTLVPGDHLNPLRLTFNIATNPIVVEAVTQQVAFHNTSASLTPGNRTIEFVLSDGDGGTSPSALQTVSVIAVADAPRIDLDFDDSHGAIGSDYNAVFLPDDGTVTIVDATDARLLDLDSPTLVSLHVQITNLLNRGSETLLATTTGTAITAAYDTTTGSLNLSGIDTVANYQQVLRTIEYGNSLPYPNTTTRVVTFVANDGTLDSNTAVSRIDLSATNDPPVVDTNFLDVAENQTLVGTVRGSDVDLPNGSLDWSITGNGLDDSLFSIDRLSGQLSFETPPNFESPFGLDNTYEVEIQVTDGQLFTTKTIDVIVLDVNEQPSLAVSNAVDTLPENANTRLGVRIADVAILDDALGTNNLVLTGPDSELFDIVESVLQFKVGALLDFETNPLLEVNVVLNDPTLGTMAAGSETIVVNVLDVNEPPIIALSNPTETVTANTDTTNGVRIADIVISDDALGSHSITLAGSNAEQFEIIGNELRLRAGTILDSQAQPNFDVIVEVQDPSLPTKFATSLRVAITGEFFAPPPPPVDPGDSEPTESENQDVNGDPISELNDENDPTPTNAGTPDTAPEATKDAGGGDGGLQLTRQQGQDGTSENESEETQAVDILTFDTNGSELADYIHERIQLTAKRNGLRAEGLVSSAFRTFTTFSVTQEFLSIVPFGEFTEAVEDVTEVTIQELIVGTTAVVSSALSVGYVIWLIRGGTIMASVLSTLPSWVAFDPLPILESANETQDELDDTGLVGITEAVMPGQQPG